MDDFFKKRLEEYTPAEDGWNVPSEELWDKAKPSFPKREKKPFFMWFSLAFLLIGIAASTWWFAGNEQHKETQALISNTSINLAEQSNEQETTKQEQSTKQALTQPIVSKEPKTPARKTTLDKTNKKTISKPVQSSKTKTNSGLTTASRPKIKSPLAKTKAVESNPVQTKQITSNINQIGFPKVSEANTPPTSKHQPSITSQSQHAAIGLATQQLFEIALLEPAALNNLIHNRAALRLAQEASPTMHVSPIIKPFEYGIAYSTYVGFKPYDEMNPTIIDGISSINAKNNKQYGLHVKTNRLYDNGLGFNSGLMYTVQNMDVDLGLAFEYQDGSSSTLRSSSSVNSDSLIIKFYDDADLKTGDLIEGSGTIRFAVSSVRLPIGLNYRLRLKQFEWYAGVGLTLGVQLIRLSEPNIYVYNQGVEVGAFDPEADQSFTFPLPEFAVYAGTGFKYHLNNQTNIGISLNLDKRLVLPRQYLRADFGVYKRI